MISNSNRDFITGMVVSKSGILNLEIGETDLKLFNDNHVMIILFRKAIKCCPDICIGVVYDIRNLRTVRLKQRKGVIEPITAYWGELMEISPSPSIISYARSTINLERNVLNLLRTINNYSTRCKDVFMHSYIDVVCIIQYLRYPGWAEIVCDENIERRNFFLYMNYNRKVSPVHSELKFGVKIKIYNVLPIFLWGLLCGFACTVRSSFIVLLNKENILQNEKSYGAVIDASPAGPYSTSEQLQSQHLNQGATGSYNNNDSNMNNDERNQCRDGGSNSLSNFSFHVPPKMRHRCVLYTAWKSLIWTRLLLDLRFWYQKGISALNCSSKRTRSDNNYVACDSASSHCHIDPPVAAPLAGVAMVESIIQAIENTVVDWEKFEIPLRTVQSEFSDIHFGPLYTVRAGQDADWLSSLLPEVVTVSQSLSAVLRCCFRSPTPSAPSTTGMVNYQLSVIPVWQCVESSVGCAAADEYTVDSAVGSPDPPSEHWRRGNGRGRRSGDVFDGMREDEKRLSGFESFSNHSTRVSEGSAAHRARASGVYVVGTLVAASLVRQDHSSRSSVHPSDGRTPEEGGERDSCAQGPQLYGEDGGQTAEAEEEDGDRDGKEPNYDDGKDVIVLCLLQANSASPSVSLFLPPSRGSSSTGQSQGILELHPSTASLRRCPCLSPSKRKQSLSSWAGVRPELDDRVSGDNRQSNLLVQIRFTASALSGPHGSTHVALIRQLLSRREDVGQRGEGCGVEPWYWQGGPRGVLLLKNPVALVERLVGPNTASGGDRHALSDAHAPSVRETFFDVGGTQNPQMIDDDGSSRGSPRGRTEGQVMYTMEVTSAHDLIFVQRPVTTVEPHITGAEDVQQGHMAGEVPREHVRRCEVPLSSSVCGVRQVLDSVSGGGGGRGKSTSCVVSVRGVVIQKTLVHEVQPAKAEGKFTNAARRKLRVLLRDERYSDCVQLYVPWRKGAHVLLGAILVCSRVKKSISKSSRRTVYLSYSENQSTIDFRGVVTDRRQIERISTISRDRTSRAWWKLGSPENVETFLSPSPHRTLHDMNRMRGGTHCMWSVRSAVTDIHTVKVISRCVHCLRPWSGRSTAVLGVDHLGRESCRQTNASDGRHLFSTKVGEHALHHHGVQDIDNERDTNPPRHRYCSSCSETRLFELYWYMSLMADDGTSTAQILVEGNDRKVWNDFFTPSSCLTEYARIYNEAAGICWELMDQYVVVSGGCISYSPTSSTPDASASLGHTSDVCVGAENQRIRGNGGGNGIETLGKKLGTCWYSMEFDNFLNYCASNVTKRAHNTSAMNTDSTPSDSRNRLPDKISANKYLHEVDVGPRASEGRRNMALEYLKNYKSDRDRIIFLISLLSRNRKRSQMYTFVVKVLSKEKQHRAEMSDHPMSDGDFYSLRNVEMQLIPKESWHSIQRVKIPVKFATPVQLEAASVSCVKASSDIISFIQDMFCV